MKIHTQDNRRAYVERLLRETCAHELPVIDIQHWRPSIFWRLKRAARRFPQGV